MPREQGVRVVARNRRATHDYTIGDTWEAGLVLQGTEVKSHMAAGAGMLFRWNATGDLAVDMHGERPDVKGAWTSYSVEAAQREARGTFTAPFEGTHGWYWQNRSDKPVTVSIEIVGYQSDIYQP